MIVNAKIDEYFKYMVEIHTVETKEQMCTFHISYITDIKIKKALEAGFNVLLDIEMVEEK